jgi:hypothetical protein
LSIADEDLERENDEKTSSVHFLRFELTEGSAEALKKGARLAVGIEHPNYAARLDAPGATCASLRMDLA